MGALAGLAGARLLGGDASYLALEVEQAPNSGRLTELSEMLDLLTSAIERVESRDEASEHLMGERVGRVQR